MNRQVPRSHSNSYLIVGRGRFARHLIHYFQLENIPYHQWHRDMDIELLLLWSLECQRILLAITDREIEAFIIRNSIPRNKALHFSGALNSTYADKLHPLMTFTDALYTREEYREIPFIGPKGKSTLAQLIPELKNPFYQILPEQFALYHALCVVSGNGTVVLWQNVMSAFQNTLGLPQEILHPYLERIFQNILENPNQALTGPWVRNDVGTIEKNKNALDKSTLLNVYKALSESLLPRSNP
jgi:2-dehydropantoate 2-reductase